MIETFDILRSLCDSLIFGFGIYIIITSLSQGIKNSIGTNVDRAAICIIIISGLGATILYLVPLLYEESRFTLKNRMFGPYGFWYWSYLLTYLLGSQLYWFRSFRSSTSFRIVSGTLLLLILLYPKYVIILTSFHRDFLPDTLYELGLPIVYGWIGDLIIFTVILAIGSQLIKRMRS